MPTAQLAAHNIGDLADRVVVGNELPLFEQGEYILVVLSRALRGADNAVIDGAIAHANTLSLPILVYSELDEQAPYASDRLYYFALGAFRELAQVLCNRNIPCIQTLKQSGDPSLLADLVKKAAAIYTDEEHTHWDKAKLQPLVDLAHQTLFLVDASRLVPIRALPAKLRTTPTFRKAHSELRERYASLRKETTDSLAEPNTPSIESLPSTHNFADYSDNELANLLANCNINHDIPISAEHPPTKAALTERITSLKENILARYKWIRNNPALAYSTSQLSPYLHFGMLSPHQLFSEINSADVPKTYTWKFRDEFLTWREWSHYQAFYNPELHEFSGLPNSAQKTLNAHATDSRPELRNNKDIIHGNTPDTTWNAAQREWLNTGWLHNNLRMYWAKQILRFTESPQAAWEMACYINDYISLDGRDPATYASLQWAFGNAKPGYGEKEIYGWVAPKSDRAILKRKGMKEWIESRQVQ
ncbi:MAG: hypothetical protein AAFR25_09005 [Cyanobacteria bacterium J06629_19]